MENIIATYCIFILFLVFAILGLMLWDDETKLRGKAKDKLILICISLIGGLVLHLNYIILPWTKAQKGELVAFISFGALAVPYSLLILSLFKSFFASKAKIHSKGKYLNKSFPY